jgi:hypothetical protein
MSNTAGEGGELGDEVSSTPPDSYIITDGQTTYIKKTERTCDNKSVRWREQQSNTQFFAPPRFLCK